MTKKLVISALTATVLVLFAFLWSGHVVITFGEDEQKFVKQKALCATCTAKPIERITVNYKKAKERLDEYRSLFADKSEHVPPANPFEPATVKKWWQAAALIHWYTESKPRYNCDNKVAFGNWAACMDPPFAIKPPCLVYSFGINFDFSFDDAMAKHGCEVHSFDPSMKTKDHKRSDRVWFHNMGLNSFDSDSYEARRDVYVKNKQLWKMKTLGSIKKMLGHSEKKIDLLKMDIEVYEWEVLGELLQSGELSMVRQFSLEFHLFPKFPLRKDFVKLYNMYTRLREEFGFLEYAVHPHLHNLKPGKYNVQSDVQFINSLFNYTSLT